MYTPTRVATLVIIQDDGTFVTDVRLTIIFIANATKNTIIRVQLGVGDDKMHCDVYFAAGRGCVCNS